jgi:vitamin B12 transporter
MRLTLCGTFLAFLSFSLCSNLKAQSNSSEARLSGTLVDASGSRVPGVRITGQLEGVRNSQVWSATSKADGNYRLAFPAGRYRIRFVQPAFVSREFTFEFAPGESRTLDLRLDLATLSASVIVTAQAEPTEAQQTSDSVSVITRDEIDKRQAVSLADAVLYVPGVAIGRTGPEGGLTSFFLDGGNSYDAKVLVDGAPVNIPGGTIDFSDFMLDNIDKVEIVRGAESALYGTDAVSGVIQLFTHRGETRVPSFSAFAEGGSFSTGRGGAQVSGLLGGFDYSGSGSYFESDGQGPNDSFRNRTESGNFGYRVNDSNQLRVALRNNTSDAGIPGQTLITPPSLHQISDLHDLSANARWDSSAGMHWRHELSGSEAYHRAFSANPIQSFFAQDPAVGCPQANPASVPTPEFCDFTNAGSISKYNRSSVNAMTSYLRANFSATAGYQYEIENADISFLGIGHLRRNNQGGYLDFRYSPQRRISLDLGARAEANGNFGTRVVPRVGGSLALRYGSGFWGDTRYRLFYGEGIVEPRFDESSGSSPCSPGNPTLKPEESKTWHTGIEQKLANDRARVSVEYFSNRFYDIISFTSCFSGSGCLIPQPLACPAFWGNFFNTDLARARGVNLLAETRQVHWLNISGNYSYDDSRVLKAPNAFDPAEIPGNRLLRRPPQSGSLTIGTEFGHFDILLAGYFSGPRTDSDFLSFTFAGACFGPCQFRNPGYARFDIATNYVLRRGVNFYARATNLFDRRYQDAVGFPALGRDVRVGMRYQFNGKN